MAKTRSDEDNDVKIDEDINRENEIDDTGDSMAKICNDNYNGVTSKLTKTLLLT